MDTITILGIETDILQIELSNRGGGIEIDLSPFGYEGEKMSAYQNYLGGGLLGSVMCNDTLRRQSNPDNIQDPKLDEISEALKQEFHDMTNPDSEWEGCTYEENQTRPSSAY